MKKARFHIEISGDCELKDNEATVLDVKQRIEVRFIPYLYEKEFGVDVINVRVHTYEDGLNMPMMDAVTAPKLDITVGEEA